MAGLEVPGWEGSVGPFPSQYDITHVYARDIYSGSGNCVCGDGPRVGKHIQVAPGFTNPGAYPGDVTMHREETLFKVYDVLKSFALVGQTAQDIVGDMLNAGILFRERIPD